MKKIILLLLISFTAMAVMAQNPLIRDNGDVHLKINTDKVGIGGPSAAAKVAIRSVAAETPLALYGYANHYNPYITLFNSSGDAIWNLYANQNWFTIGSSIDSTTALIVGKHSKSWLRINGTGKFTNLLGTTGTITTLGATTATFTNSKSTRDTTANAVVTKLEHRDSTGIVMYNSAGTKYRLYISSNGAVKVSTVP
jgi:hypothetical protein